MEKGKLPGVTGDFLSPHYTHTHTHTHTKPGQGLLATRSDQRAKPKP